MIFYAVFNEDTHEKPLALFEWMPSWRKERVYQDIGDFASHLGIE